MGIIIENYKLFNNSVTVPSAYLKIRDIKVSKETEETIDACSNTILTKTFLFSFDIIVEANSNTIDSFVIEDFTTSVDNTDPWIRSYNLVKQKLKNENYNFSDVLI